MSSDLTTKKCQLCAKNTPPFSFGEAKTYLTQIPNWSLSPDAKSISRELVMKDFLAAIRLMNQIAEVAEAEDHHPDFHLTGYRKLRIELANHSIGGLSENDFILAAKIDELPKELKKST